MRYIDTDFTYLINFISKVITQWEIMSDLCHYLSWETMDVNYIFSHYKMFLEMYIEHCNPNALLNYLNKAKSSYYFSFWCDLDLTSLFTLKNNQYIKKFAMIIGEHICLQITLHKWHLKYASDVPNNTFFSYNNENTTIWIHSLCMTS